ncbi:class I tRNA ligase family protein, partial [bacterium]|nr:class I tRNA ligase family protein [bacterium]
MARKILVTSALPYSNGPIHIGHLAGAYLPADIFVRYQRLMGSDVVFICGADEHGVPIIIAAGKEGITPQQLVDKYYALNRDSFAALGIAFDNFSRTSLPVHYETS